MSYITKAFVRILDIELLNKIRLQLIELGYKSFYSGGQTQLAINKGLYALNAPDIDGFIDCNHYANGDEEKAIELFLELAKMQDEATEDSYVEFIHDVFIGFELYATEGSIFRIEGLVNNDNSYRVLLPLELAEAFKQGKINLK